MYRVLYIKYRCGCNFRRKIIYTSMWYTVYTRYLYRLLFFKKLAFVCKKKKKKKTYTEYMKCDFCGTYGLYVASLEIQFLQCFQLCYSTAHKHTDASIFPRPAWPIKLHFLQQVRVSSRHKRSVYRVFLHLYIKILRCMGSRLFPFFNFTKVKRVLLEKVPPKNLVQLCYSL